MITLLRGSYKDAIKLAQNIELTVFILERTIESLTHAAVMIIRVSQRVNLKQK